MGVISSHRYAKFLRLITLTILFIFVLSKIWIISEFPFSSKCASSYNTSNQTLHRSINTLPIESLVLRSPRFDNQTKFGIVILVIGAHYEKNDRDEIRRLWTSQNESKMQKKGKSLVIFVVGRSVELEGESEQYGDLLQIDIDETYRNMVYKIGGSYRWVNENVNAEFVVKVDSDTVVHIDRLYEQLKRYEINQSNDWLACYNFRDNRPNRDPCSPWFVSQSEYAHEIFPPYCRGGGYSMKKSTMSKIIERMGKHNVIEVEDIFFTGIATTDMNVTFLQGTIPFQYTDYSNCDIHGPSISLLNTHHQFGLSKSKKNLTAAWMRLKNPLCHTFLTRLVEI